MLGTQPLPLRYDFVGIWEVAVDVFHLDRVGVTDLVVRAAIVGRLDHDDVAPRASEVDGVTFARELPAYQAEWESCSTECWKSHKKEEISNTEQRLYCIRSC